MFNSIKANKKQMRVSKKPLSTCPLCLCLDLTEQRSFSPVSIPNLNVVIPTQTAFIQIHSGEVKNNLEKQKQIQQKKQNMLNAFGTDFQLSESTFRGLRAEEVGGICDVKTSSIYSQSVSSLAFIGCACTFTALLGAAECVCVCVCVGVCVCIHLFSRCYRYSPDTVRVGRVSIGVTGG